MSVKIGDLVKMKSDLLADFGNFEPGLVLRLHNDDVGAIAIRWVEVMWPDDGLCMEKIRDLEVLAD